MNALRKRIWLRVLDRVERGIIDLTIKFIENVRSRVLTGTLVKTLAKLEEATKSVFIRHIEEYGTLKQTVEQAKSLGSLVSDCWLEDKSYAMWFAFNNHNNPVG